MARRHFLREATSAVSDYLSKRLFGLGPDDSFAVGNVYGSDTKSENRLDSYRGIVYACINLIAESVGVYQPMLYKQNKGKKDQVEDHPLLRLLKKPGGTDDKAIPITQYDIFYATAAFIELQGDVYWYMAKGRITGEPREIVILRADKVGRNLNRETGDIESFYVISRYGTKVQIEIDEMVPFVGFNPKNPYQGIGTTEAADDYIMTDEYSTKFTKNFFKNNAGLSGVLSVGGDLTKAAFRKFVRKWREKYQGVDNAGKVMMVRGSDAAKFEKVGLGLNELDMSSLRKMSQDDIGMMYGVPLPLLGKIPEGVGFGRANIEVLEYIFAKYKTDKVMQRLDQIMKFVLDRYWPQDSDIQISHVSTIPEDKEFKLNELDKGVDRWITRNEIREEQGKEPVDGGDQLRAPIASLPINEDLSGGDPNAGKGITIKIKRHVEQAPKEQKKKTQVK